MIPRIARSSVRPCKVSFAVLDIPVLDMCDNCVLESIFSQFVAIVKTALF